MQKHKLVWILLFLPTLALAQPRQDRLHPPLRTSDEEEAWLNDPKRPKVKLYPLPPIALPAEPVLTSEEAKHISVLIAQLAHVADYDFSLPTTTSRYSFAPVPDPENTEEQLSPNGPKRTPAVLELVKLGPRVLPFLLKHLDDVTPTKLTIEHKGFFGGMGFGHEIEFNEANSREHKVSSKVKQEEPNLFHPPLTTYTVKVGDVCFNIIGQIVGRSYLAVRYQPEAIIIINSPVADSKLAQEVRTVWTSTTPTHHLFHSLLTDYSCRGVSNGESFDEWDIGNNLQCAAAMRLLYYFPAQTAALIAVRLHNLKVQRTGLSSWGEKSTDKELAALEKRERANGVRTDAFVKAVSWCPDPRIQAEIAAIVTRTGATEVMAAAVQGIAPSQRKALTPRIEAFLRALPPSKKIRNYDSYLVLETLAHCWAKDAKPIFHDYLQKRVPVDLNSVCNALCVAGTGWKTEILLPLLADRRTIPGSGHWTTPKGEGPEILTRVCDAAAQALAFRRPGVKFEMDQPYVQLDAEIAAIKTRLEH